MANHKWENDKCVQCGLYRTEIEILDGGKTFHYSFDNNQWLVKRPECEKSKSYIQSINIKEQVNKLRVNTNYKQDYSDLLRNPKWQRKRLEIMQRDQWECLSCGNNENELHVHHIQYTADKPWEELDDNLITLCHDCHEAVHYLKKCDFAGIETFISVCLLMNKLECASIDKYLQEHPHV